MENTAIHVQGITKRFGNNVAVNNVSFDIKKGEVVGFLGPNGSGKTTTMRMLTCFYTPDKGNILIHGIDNQQDDINTRKMIGYLPENNPIYADMLVTEYLNFVADLRQLKDDLRKDAIDEAVDLVGIGEVFYRPLGQCSKGFKQRVGLAQAILHRPQILIMDEPTEGLDPNQRVQIRELIRRIGQERTVLLSTHVLQEVEETCDRVLIISKGRIVAQGTVDDIQSDSSNSRMVYVELEGQSVEDSLKKIKGVKSVRNDGTKNNRKRFTVTTKRKEDCRAEVFRLAKRLDWTLWELHEVKPSLQSIFQGLTSSETELEQ